MYLSHPKIPSKPVKSALPVFGSISRSPRTPASSSLYSESSDGGSQGVQYSDTFVSESGIPSVGYQRKKTPRKTMISFKENDVTETIETEIPFTGRSVTEMPFTERNGKSHTERATTEIETCISENESEKFFTVTERIPSLSETKSSHCIPTRLKVTNLIWRMRNHQSYHQRVTKNRQNMIIQTLSIPQRTLVANFSLPRGIVDLSTQRQMNQMTAITLHLRRNH